MSASRNGRIGGRTASPKWARMRASSLSFLASWPVDLAKSRTWRGLTTATGNAAAGGGAGKEFRDMVEGLIGRLTAKNPPRKAPSVSECRFCPIPREYCPERVEH